MVGRDFHIAHGIPYAQCSLSAISIFNKFVPEVRFGCLRPDSVVAICLLVFTELHFQAA